MRNGVKKRQFGRTNKQRDALMRSLVRALVMNESITTTEAKAKVLRKVIDKVVTEGRKSTLASKRFLISYIGQDGTQKLVSDVLPRVARRSGGYTRLFHLPPRLSDGARMAKIMFSD